MREDTGLHQPEREEMVLLAPYQIGWVLAEMQGHVNEQCIFCIRMYVNISSI